MSDAQAVVLLLLLPLAGFLVTALIGVVAAPAAATICSRPVTSQTIDARSWDFREPC